MMRKILALISLFTLSINYCFAISKEEANIKVTALRRAKQAKVSVINKEIDKKSKTIAEIYSNVSIPDNEKEQKMKKIQEEINNLLVEKNTLNEQYIKDKKAIKKQIGKKI